MKTRWDFLKVSGLGIAGSAALKGRKYEEPIKPILLAKDPEDLLPGLAESVGYVRGVLDTLI